MANNIWYPGCAPSCVFPPTRTVAYRDVRSELEYARDAIEKAADSMGAICMMFQDWPSELQVLLSRKPLIDGQVKNLQKYTSDCFSDIKRIIEYHQALPQHVDNNLDYNKTRMSNDIINISDDISSRVHGMDNLLNELIQMLEYEKRKTEKKVKLRKNAEEYSKYCDTAAKMSGIALQPHLALAFAAGDIFLSTVATRMEAKESERPSMNQIDGIICKLKEAILGHAKTIQSNLAKFQEYHRAVQQRL